MVGPGRPFDLMAICLVVVISVILSQLGIDSPLLWVLAFFSVYFAPGYAVMSLVFPGNRVLLLDSLLIKRRTVTRQVTAIERIALSFILSITVIAIAGVILMRSLLDLTPTGVGIEIMAITLGVSILAFYARTRLPSSSQLEYSIVIGSSGGRLSAAEKLIASVIVAGVVVAGIAVFMGLEGLDGGEPYTEFYITGPGGDIARLPSVLNVGEDGTVLINIVNHEGSSVTYNLTLGLTNDSSFSELNPLSWDSSTSISPEAGHYALVGVQDDGAEELNLTFSVSSPGEFRLYLQLKNGDSTKELWTWLEIVVPE
ncbi:MAG: DUF1616 domain-containing protein [Methanomassiliicoccales archaeon]|nr:DUF1616 domain-containing protein [Methanomassiliicoccales archaeon]